MEAFLVGDDMGVTGTVNPDVVPLNEEELIHSDSGSTSDGSLTTIGVGTTCRDSFDGARDRVTDGDEDRGAGCIGEVADKPPASLNGKKGWMVGDEAFVADADGITDALAVGVRDGNAGIVDGNVDGVEDGVVERVMEDVVDGVVEGVVERVMEDVVDGDVSGLEDPCEESIGDFDVVPDVLGFCATCDAEDDVGIRGPNKMGTGTA